MAQIKYGTIYFDEFEFAYLHSTMAQIKQSKLHSFVNRLYYLHSTMAQIKYRGKWGKKKSYIRFTFHYGLD